MGSPESVQILLDYGANPNYEYSYGSPLYYTGASGNCAAAAALLQHGANPKARSGKEKEKPLERCIRAKAEAGGKAEMGDFDALLELLQAAEDDELAAWAGTPRYAVWSLQAASDHTHRESPQRRGSIKVFASAGSDAEVLGELGDGRVVLQAGESTHSDFVKVSCDYGTGFCPAEELLMVPPPICSDGQIRAPGVELEPEVDARPALQFLGDFVSFYEVLERSCEEDSAISGQTAGHKVEEQFELSDGWCSDDAHTVEGIVSALLDCTKKGSSVRSRCSVLLEEILSMANKLGVTTQVLDDGSPTVLVLAQLITDLLNSPYDGCSVKNGACLMATSLACGAKVVERLVRYNVHIVGAQVLESMPFLLISVSNATASQELLAAISEEHFGPGKPMPRSVILQHSSSREVPRLSQAVLKHPNGRDILTRLGYTCGAGRRSLLSPSYDYFPSSDVTEWTEQETQILDFVRQSAFSTRWRENYENAADNLAKAQALIPARLYRELDTISLEKLCKNLSANNLASTVQLLSDGNVGDVLPSQAASSGFAEALVNAVTTPSGSLDSTACEALIEALYQGRLVPNTPGSDAEDVEWAAWAQFLKHDPLLEKHEITLSRVLRDGTDGANKADLDEAIKACKMAGRTAQAAEARLACVVELLHGTISTLQNLPVLSNRSRGAAHGLEMLKQPLRCFLEGDSGDLHVEVLAWPVTSGEELMRWGRHFAEAEDWPSVGSLCMHQESRTRGVITAVDAERTHVDVEYSRAVEGLATTNVPVAELQPLQRPAMHAGMTLQRQFSGLVAFNPEEESSAESETEQSNPIQMLRRVHSGHSSQFKLHLTLSSSKNAPRVPILRGSTLLQAANRLFVQLDTPGRSPWDCRYRIVFTKVDEDEGEDADPNASSLSLDPNDATVDTLAPQSQRVALTQWDHTIANWQLPEHIPAESRALRCAIALLLLIDCMEKRFGARKLTKRSGMFSTPVATVVPSSEYLTSALHQQLQDCVTLCSQAWPRWCASLPSYLPALFAPDERESFFFRTAFGVSRAVHFTQEHELANDPQRFRMGRLRSVEVTLTRANAGDEAVAILKKHAARPDKLVFVYSDAASVGSGVNQDFFTLASQALRRQELKLWRLPEAEAASGLFPAELPHTDPEESSRVLAWFQHLGRVLGRALMEQHLIDIPLALPVYQVLCGKPITGDQLCIVDKEYSNSLAALKGYSVEDLEALELHFDDLGDYGDEQFVSRLSVFSPHELRSLLEGDGVLGTEDWTVAELAKVIEFKSDGRQGEVTQDDPLYQAVLEYLSAATDPQRRAFLRFCTSSPNLPVGGLKQLKPRLSVLTNHIPQWAKESGIAHDSVPPSTSTCERILRIPPYSSAEVLCDWLSAATFNEHAQYFKDNA